MLAVVWLIRDALLVLRCCKILIFTCRKSNQFYLFTLETCFELYGQEIVVTNKHGAVVLRCDLKKVWFIALPSLFSWMSWFGTFIFKHHQRLAAFYASNTSVWSASLVPLCFTYEVFNSKIFKFPHKLLNSFFCRTIPPICNLPVCVEAFFKRATGFHKFKRFLDLNWLTFFPPACVFVKVESCANLFPRFIR